MNVAACVLQFRLVVGGLGWGGGGQDSRLTARTSLVPLCGGGSPKDSLSTEYSEYSDFHSP